MFYSYSEVNSGFFYKTAAEREKLVAAERKFTDDKVMEVIKLKKKVRDSFLFCSMGLWESIFCITNRSAMVVTMALLSSIKR